MPTPPNGAFDGAPLVGLFQLITPALTAGAHVAGVHGSRQNLSSKGWWDAMVGPGKPKHRDLDGIEEQIFEPGAADAEGEEHGGEAGESKFAIHDRQDLHITSVRQRVRSPPLPSRTD